MGERVNGSEACERKGLGFAIYAPSLDACRARRPIGPLLFIAANAARLSDRSRARSIGVPGFIFHQQQTCRFHVAGSFRPTTSSGFSTQHPFTLSYKQHTRTRHGSGDAPRTSATHARTWLPRSLLRLLAAREPLRNLCCRGRFNPIESSRQRISVMAQTDTRSLQQIKRETEQTRAGLTDTVEQLKTSVAETASDIRHRISPEAIKAEVSDYIKSRGEQLLHDATSAARRNPMQAVAVGASVAYPL